MLNGDELSARIAWILKAQRASILAVDSVHSDGTWAEYVLVSDRVYTETARTLRDAKADAVRGLARVGDSGSMSSDVSLEDAIAMIDEHLDEIVGMKAALRQVRTRVNPQDPFPGHETCQPLLVDALKRVRDMGAITPEVFDLTLTRVETPASSVCGSGGAASS